MSWYWWILIFVAVYTGLRYMWLADHCGIECFDFNWPQWFLCGFRPHKYQKKEYGMLAYCKYCGEPTFYPDPRE